MRQQIQRVADIVRSQFESALLRRKGAPGLVIELAIFNVMVVGSMSWFQKRLCSETEQEVRIIDLELTFSAHRFDTLLSLLKPGTCRPFFQWTLVSFDVLFPIGYGLGLCALFLWAERQRRFKPKEVPIDEPLPFRNHVFVLVPLLAGLIDIVLENGSLLAAALLLYFKSADSLLVAALVCIGSLGAAIKWSLVVFSILTIISEVLSCSRGRVLRRLRIAEQTIR